MAEKSLRIAIKSDLRDGQKLTGFLKTIQQQAEKLAKTLGGVNIGGTGPNGQARPGMAPGQQGLSKQLTDDKRAMEAMGREVDNLGRKFTNFNRTVNGPTPPRMPSWRPGGIGGLPPAGPLGPGGAAPPGGGGGGGPGGPGGMPPGGPGGGGGAAASQIMGAVGLGGPAALMRLSMPAAVVATAVIVARELIKTPELNATLGLQLESQTAAIRGNISLRQMRGDPSLGIAAKALEDPNRREDFETAGKWRGRWAGAKEFLRGVVNPFRADKWKEAAEAARAESRQEQLSRLENLQPEQAARAQIIKERARSRTLARRRFGRESFDPIVTTGMRNFYMPEEETSGLMESVSQFTGARGVGRSGIVPRAQAAALNGWRPGAAAQIMGQTAVGGGNVFGRLQGMDPAVGELMGRAVGGTMGAGALLSGGEGFTGAMQTGVGGGTMGMRRAQQNISGMQAMGSLGGGFDPYQKTINMANAVNVMGKGGNIYGQMALADIGADPRLLADIMSGKSKLPRELRAMGIKDEDVQAFGKKTINSVMNRYINQRGGKDTDAGKLINRIRTDFGGDLQGFLKKESKTKRFEGEVQDLAGVFKQMAPELFESYGQAEGFLRVAGGMGAPGKGVKRRAAVERGEGGLTGAVTREDPEFEALKLQYKNATEELEGMTDAAGSATKSIQENRRQVLENTKAQQRWNEVMLQGAKHFENRVPKNPTAGTGR